MTFEESWDKGQRRRRSKGDVGLRLSERRQQVRAQGDQGCGGKGLQLQPWRGHKGKRQGSAARRRDGRKASWKNRRINDGDHALHIVRPQGACAKRSNSSRGFWQVGIGERFVGKGLSPAALRQSIHLRRIYLSKKKNKEQTIMNNRHALHSITTCTCTVPKCSDALYNKLSRPRLAAYRRRL